MLKEMWNSQLQAVNLPFHRKGVPVKIPDHNYCTTWAEWNLYSVAHCGCSWVMLALAVLRSGLTLGEPWCKQSWHQKGAGILGYQKWCLISSSSFNAIFWLRCRRSSQDEIVTNSTCCSNCCYCFNFLEAVVEWLLQQSTILQENVFLQNHFFLVSANKLVSWSQQLLDTSCPQQWVCLSYNIYAIFKTGICVLHCLIPGWGVLVCVQFLTYPSVLMHDPEVEMSGQTSVSFLTSCSTSPRLPGSTSSRQVRHVQLFLCGRF